MRDGGHLSLNRSPESLDLDLGRLKTGLAVSPDTFGAHNLTRVGAPGLAFETWDVSYLGCRRLSCYYSLPTGLFDLLNCRL